MVHTSKLYKVGHVELGGLKLRNKIVAHIESEKKQFARAAVKKHEEEASLGEALLYFKFSDCTSHSYFPLVFLASSSCVAVAVAAPASNKKKNKRGQENVEMVKEVDALIIPKTVDEEYKPETWTDDKILHLEKELKLQRIRELEKQLAKSTTSGSVYFCFHIDHYFQELTTQHLFPFSHFF